MTDEDFQDLDRIAKVFVGLFWFGIGLVFVIVVVVTGLALTLPAKARDNGQYANSPNKAWFDKLASKKGLCCSFADGTAVEDADWRSQDGHYQIKLEDRWWDVPDDAVITEPNRVGRTMVWPIVYRDGEIIRNIQIRCFMPGIMT